SGVWTEFTLVDAWPEAADHRVSLGCGSAATFFDDVASVFVADTCVPADRDDAIAVARTETGALLAGAPGTKQGLGAWTAELARTELRIRGSYDALHTASIEHRVHRGGRWYETAEVDLRFDGDAVHDLAYAPPGFGDALERFVRLATSQQQVEHYVRSAPGPWSLDVDELAPAIDVRVAQEGWRFGIAARDLPDALALHLRLQIETPEHDEPPGVWDFVVPPSHEVLTLPDVPSVLTETAINVFVNGEAHLVAGQTDRAAYRRTHIGWLAGRGPDPRDAGGTEALTLTTWRDPDLKR
ncbi:MAG: hypothetical protein AAF211_26045, partial [Myxococcota bacterium]